MKNFKHFLSYFAALMLLAAPAFTSCSDDEETPKEPDTVKVTSITITPATLTLAVGETATVSVQVLPANATNKSFNYDIADAAIAKIEGNTVTALAAGNTTLTATTEDGNKVASCLITVTGGGNNNDNPGEGGDVELSFAASAAVYYGDAFGAAEQGLDLDYNMWIADFVDESVANGSEEGMFLEVFFCTAKDTTSITPGTYAVATGAEYLQDYLFPFSLFPFLTLDEETQIGSFVTLTGAYYDYIITGGSMDVALDGDVYTVTFNLEAADIANSSETEWAYVTLTGSYNGTIDQYNSEDLAQQAMPMNLNRKDIKPVAFR